MPSVSDKLDHLTDISDVRFHDGSGSHRRLPNCNRYAIPRTITEIGPPSFSFSFPSLVPLGFQPDSVTATAAKPTISMAPGMPFGISFIGTAFGEFKLISYAFAYEQATHNRLKRLAYKEAIPKTQLKDVIG